MAIALGASSREVGRQKEELALDYFLQKGWALLERNFSTALGEIDLIFRDPQKTVVFVEVKYRSSSGFGGPLAAVGRAKQRRIVKTALSYIKKYRLEGLSFRFDVWGIFPNEVEHVPNAFGAEGYTL